MELLLLAAVEDVVEAVVATVVAVAAAVVDVEVVTVLEELEQQESDDMVDDDEQEASELAASAMARSKSSSSLSRRAHRPTFGWLERAITAPFFFDLERGYSLLLDCLSFLELIVVGYLPPNDGRKAFGAAKRRDLLQLLVADRLRHDHVFRVG
jgi:hypothetical protein